MQEIASMMGKLHTFHTYDVYVASATSGVFAALAAIDDFDSIDQLTVRLSENKKPLFPFFQKELTVSDHVRMMYGADKHRKVVAANKPVYIPLLNLNTGDIVFKNITVLPYGEALLVLCTSAQSPCESKPSYIDSDYYITATIVDNIGFYHVVEQVDIIHIDMVIPRKRLVSTNWNPNHTSVVERVFALINNKLTAKQEFEISVISEARDVKTTIYFLDSVVAEPV